MTASGDVGIEEAEANAFAAELLIPHSWLISLIAENSFDLTPVLEIVEQAQASATASVIALARALPPGWALQMNNQPVVSSVFGDRLDRASLNLQWAEQGSATVHSQKVRWWRAFSPVALPRAVEDKVQARALLDASILSLGGELTRQRVEGIVAGYLGADTVRATRNEVAYAYLLWRSKSSPIAALVDDVDFRTWLAWKVAVRASART